MKLCFCFSLIVLSLALTPRKGCSQWVQTNGPYGGWVFCVQPFGNDIFIGTIGGVFESTDQGSNWVQRCNGLPGGLYVYSLTTHGPYIFAGTLQHGIYRSTDSGASWSSASSGLPNSYSVRVLGSSNDAIYAPDEEYSYMSTNDGDEWELVDTNLTKISVPESIFSIDSSTYLAGKWITETTDDGLHWGVTAVPPAGDTWDINSMANIGEILFAVNFTSGILRSIDHGVTWTYVLGDSLLQSVLFVATIGTELFAANSGGPIYRSIDSGTTWQPASSGIPIDVELSSIASNGTVLFVGTYGPGVFRSFDSGRTWSQCNQGLLASMVQAITSFGDTALAGTTSGVFLSTDNGLTWQPKQNGLTDYDIGCLLVDSDNLYCGSQSGDIQSGIFRSTDRGESWTLADSGLQVYSANAIVRSGQNLVAAGGNNDLLESTDNGVSWSLLDSKFVQSYQIYVSQFLNFGGRLFAATGDGLYLSYDGVNWQKSLDGIAYSQQIVVWSIGTVGSKVFIHCTPNSFIQNLGIFVSSDFGLTWQAASDTLFPPRGHVTCFTSTGDSLFAATDSCGIFLSTDSGVHWTSENSGLGDSNILSITFQGNELLAGTASSGVWERPLIPPSNVTRENPPEKTISVYPDPASSLVTISCPDIKGAMEASLISITGITVWNRTLIADGSAFQLDFSGIADGAYRLELNAGDVQQSVNIVLER